MRSSTGFRLGAGLLALCALMQLALLHVPFDLVALPALAVILPWWLFVVALVVVGAAFSSLTVRHFCGSAGILPGSVHLLQAVFVLLVLRGTREIYPLAPHLPLLKYGALAGFALLERRYLSGATRHLLLGVAMAQIAKILLRTFVTLPPTATRTADGILVLVQVVALGLLAADVHFEEDLWARNLLGSAGATIEDLDDPRGGRP
jgi:hypothetical protein